MGKEIVPILDTRTVFHLSISSNEKDMIKKIADKYHQSMSEFIRQAIFEKIARVENPIQDHDFGKSEAILKHLMQVGKQVLINSELLRVYGERYENGKVIKHTLNKIGDAVEDKNLEKECDKILEALEDDPLRPNEIKEITGLEIKTIYEALGKESKRENPRFDLNFMTARFYKVE